MEESLRWIGRLTWLNRGDVGFCSEEIMAWHEPDNKPQYLFKLRLTKNLKRAVARLKEEDWQGCHNFGILHVGYQNCDSPANPLLSSERLLVSGSSSGAA